MRIVGVDCATTDTKVGLAIASLERGRLAILEATLCAREKPAVGTIASWLEALDEGGLLAIDAPLGWPKPLAEALINHSAGNAIGTDPNALFRRATDAFIQSELHKTPLDVGADRIARAAHAALTLLTRLRLRLGRPIPLAWASDHAAHLAAIEVHPAATLIAHRMPSRGYKKRSQIAARQEIAAALRTRMHIDDSVQDITRDANLIDAVVCVLAGADFLHGSSMEPANRQLASREGWIWVRRGN